MLRTADLDYELPESSIATTPASPRDSAKLLVVSRSDRALLKHQAVRDLPEILRAGDLVVPNETRVLPARFRGARLDSGGGVQGLFLAEERSVTEPPPNGAPTRWVVLVKSRRQAPGVRIGLFDRSGKQSGLILNLLTRSADENGAWVSSIETTDGNPISTLNALEKVGLTPLPPYILQARKHEGLRRNDQADRAAYQTVFARPQETPHGSVAAPTAGLHFTPELLERLSIVGIARAPLTLHVGTGTFKHVETEFVEQHTMHGEWCSTSAQTGTSIIRTRDAGGRIIAIGTTAARALESFAGPEDLQRGGQMVTRLLITPGFRWKFTDGLLTNFHLPRSTLLALVGAFLGPEGEGVERLKALYRVAIDNNYRFYSFGDAMLILP